TTFAAATPIRFCGGTTRGDPHTGVRVDSNSKPSNRVRVADRGELERRAFSMRSMLGLIAGALASLVRVLGGSAQAQPSPQTQALKFDQPGSLLIYPLVQGDARRDTFLTVTNTNLDCTACGNRFRFGDVVIQINWIDPSDCSEVNSSFALSPG